METLQDTIPAPGSDEAVERGCKCPVLDNEHGEGAYYLNGVPQYWINDACPIHGLKKYPKTGIDNQ